jgi:hypothetical protein
VAALLAALWLVSLVALWPRQFQLTVGSGC